MLAGLFSVSLLEARTWTSSDGTKTFKGDIRRYDEGSGKVTVLKGFREVSFRDEVLSDEDRKWLLDWANKQEVSESSDVDGDLDKQKIGSKLTGGVLSKLDGGKFVDYEMATAPDYYVVYYSASW